MPILWADAFEVFGSDPLKKKLHKYGGGSLEVRTVIRKDLLTSEGCCAMEPTTNDNATNNQARTHRTQEGLHGLAVCLRP